MGAPVLVMGALSREERAAGDGGRGRRGGVDRARSPTAAPRVHVKLDTGMGRLGTKDRDEALRLAGRPNVTGLMTHFATADEPGDDQFPAQLDAFRSFVEAVGRDDLVVHAANSAATLRDPASHFDMVRCGIAIYGMDPFHEDPAAHGLEPALSLHSWVAAVRRFEAGDSGGLRPALDGRGAVLGRDGPDRLRRRLAARAHERLRRARSAAAAIRWSAPSAWTT